ncbi:MAG: hypothetical protein MUC60_09955 [Oscillatoria sp. Prado101]|jgi:hypothetical protein|nr:hypothetical protein [Oscillatoria sp. Prado101]
MSLRTQDWGFQTGDSCSQGQDSSGALLKMAIFGNLWQNTADMSEVSRKLLGSGLEMPGENG